MVLRSVLLSALPTVVLLGPQKAPLWVPQLAVRKVLQLVAQSVVLWAAVGLAAAGACRNPVGDVQHLLQRPAKKAQEGLVQSDGGRRHGKARHWRADKCDDRHGHQVCPDSAGGHPVEMVKRGPSMPR